MVSHPGQGNVSGTQYILCSLGRPSCAPSSVVDSEHGKHAHTPAQPSLSHPACLWQLPGRSSTGCCTFACFLCFCYICGLDHYRVCMLITVACWYFAAWIKALPAPYPDVHQLLHCDDFKPPMPQYTPTRSVNCTTHMPPLDGMHCGTRGRTHSVTQRT